MSVAENGQPATRSTTLQAGAPKSVQKFHRDSFHRWYGFVLGFSDQLVDDILNEFQPTKDSVILDPFCGSGTTIVECVKRGYDAIGLDANPFAVFAANTKCKMDLDPDAVRRAYAGVRRRYNRFVRSNRRYKSGAVYDYLSSSGMIQRGWISPKPLRKALALREAILGCKNEDLRNALLLALLTDLPANIGNMKFGPQIYVGRVRTDVDLISLFQKRVWNICADLRAAKMIGFSGNRNIFVGDARQLHATLVGKFGPRSPSVDFVISSPPYPTEHDYTRHTRLELAFSDLVASSDNLRSIKRSMVRSHTKGIYQDDLDALQSRSIASVEKIAKIVEVAIMGKTSGFEKLYPTVIRSYFGGMRQHFESVFKVMKPGGRAAYVVGDQAAYARIPIRTAILLGETAESVGFQVESIRLWRKRWATGIKDYLDENILILRKPEL